MAKLRSLLEGFFTAFRMTGYRRGILEGHLRLKWLVCNKLLMG